MLAAFGMGCFWGSEEIFRRVKGVIKTLVGYMGGSTKNPTYPEVCTSLTGHIETVQVEYNPEIISYEKLLEFFWKNHNPTTLNRQGLDLGTQYSSVIFYYNEAQRKNAEESIKKEQEKRKQKIVTQIRKASAFYLAEEYHQKYYMKKGGGKCAL